MAVPEPTDREVEANSLRLHYLDWGNQGAPPLVLLHGFMANAHIWDLFAPVVQPSYHVLAVDQRGHGDSAWAADGYRQEQYLADLEALLDRLQLPRVALVGFSMGGRNAFVFAAQHPERVERLVIVDIGPEIGKRLLERAGQPGPPEPESFASPAEAANFLRAGNPHPSDDYLLRIATHSLRRREDGRMVWKWDPALKQRPLELQADFLWDCLARLQCPTLIVRGAESIVLDREVAERMQQVVPDCRLVEIPAAGHPSMEDNPSAFNAAVAGFLATPPAP